MQSTNVKTVLVPFSVIIACVLLLLSVDAAGGENKTPPLPKFEKIEQAVWRYFQAQQDFQSGDLITKQQVEPLFAVLKSIGFSVADPQAILDQIPDDSEFLAVELYAPAGRKFMKDVAKFPQAYDRLDRLSRLPHGKQTVRDLIRGPDGYKMIQYMTTAPGGKQMGKMLSQAPQGANFNKPTERIYTVSMLLKRLREQYSAPGKKPSVEK
jgi:hypothetical protein